METNRENAVVRDNRDAARFELEVDGSLAVAEYTLAPDGLVLHHTVVPVELEGRGIGSRLAKAALDSASQRKLMVTPKCPFMASYIHRHPEYHHLVPPTFRSPQGP